MRIYVINLARAAERREKMARQCAALGLACDWIEASDGRALTEAEFALVDHGKRRFLSPYPLSRNEIGCWLSHRRAIGQLLASGDAMAAVLEDDLKLSPDLPAALDAIERAGGDFDLIDLHRKFRKNETFVPCRRLPDGVTLGRLRYGQMCAYGYIMSRQGAEKFLAGAGRFADAVDKALHSYWRNGLDIYALERPLVENDDAGISYIEEDRHQDDGARRDTYPGAETLKWRAARQLTKLVNSLRKRRAYRALPKR